MAFRPEWYQNERRPSRFGAVGSWSALRLLMTLNFGVFALQMLAFLASDRTAEPISTFLGLRAWMPGPQGSAGAFNLFFPVQLVTYMFVHSLDIWHVGLNMLYLWFFGRDLENSMGKAGFLRFYFIGGVVGGLAQWGLNLAQGDPVPVVGASGAVYAVMALFALRYPRRSIIILPIPIPIPIIFVAGFKVAGDIMGLLRGDPTVAFLAHLGGAAIGVLWFFRGDMVAKAQDTISRKRAQKQASQSADDRREMDRILRKIQSDGLPSLTPTERSFLERRSQELRDQGR